MAILGTGPPVRLRMLSADRLCARAMLVEWEDGAETRQRWASSEDALQNGWYEAEKLLPPSATNIAVQFKLRVPRKQIDVLAVNRHDNCSWVLLGEKRYVPEIITFRVGTSPAHDPVDAVFELRGPLHRCFVHRAWNAARQGSPEEWESWEDGDSRPGSEGDPETLAAANSAAVPRGHCEVEAYLEDATERFSAAALRLLGVHRETLRALKGLDASCTGQWLRANLGTSASAGFMIAAVPMVFVLPPVGVGLAIAGSVAGSAALGGNALEERWNLAHLKHQLSTDNWNAFVTMELLKEWIRASEAAGRRSFVADPADTRAHDSSQVGSVSKSIAYAVAMFGDELGAALPVLGPIGVAVGAVLTTGIAIHGWGTQKFSQREIRGQMSQLRIRLLFHQYLLSRLGRLVCPICNRGMAESDCLRCCVDQAHYCHDECWQELHGSANCPTCGGQLRECTTTIADDCKEIASCKAPASPAGREGGRAGGDRPGEGGLPPEPAGAAMDDAALLELIGRVADVRALMSEPPDGEEQAQLVEAEIRECEAGAALLEAFVDGADAADHGDNAESALRAADALEQLRGLQGAYESWIGAPRAYPSEVQAADCQSPECDSAPASEEQQEGAPPEPAPPAGEFEFAPPARAAGAAPDGRRPGSVMSAFHMMGHKVSGVRGTASQRASALGQSASSVASAVASEVSGARAAAAQKASQAASDIKSKASTMKDKSAGMAASLLKEKTSRS